MFRIMKISPKQYKKFENFEIKYGTVETKYGQSCLGFHNDALCYLVFYNGNKEPMEKLERAFPAATFVSDQTYVEKRAVKFFENDPNDLDLELFLVGTDFEMEVWEALLTIKRGQTISYEGLAVQMGRHRAVRAVARAVAKNFISYLIPCHRVISKSGALHKYGGGVHRKAMILRDECAIH